MEGWTDQSCVCSLPWFVPHLLSPHAHPHIPLPPPLTAEPSGALFSSLPSATEPPKKKRSAVLDGILEQLEDADNDDSEQALQL